MAGGTGRRFWPYSRKALPKQFLDFLELARHSCSKLTKDISKFFLLRIFSLRLTSITENWYLTRFPVSANPTWLWKRNTGIRHLPLHTHRISFKNQSGCQHRSSSFRSLDSKNGWVQTRYSEIAGICIPLGQAPDIGHQAQLSGNGLWLYSGFRRKEEDFYKVKTFIEKPLLEFAEVFVQSNEFYWNSGIFVWHVNTILKAFHEMMAEVCPQVECDMPKFSTCPNSSIDYSIMEKADNVYVLLCDSDGQTSAHGMHCTTLLPKMRIRMWRRTAMRCYITARTISSWLPKTN